VYGTLQAHPTLSDMERKKVCSLMDCQKLSREACAHAAQNDRLPVQTVVQVLYYEQQRLREAVNDSGASPANAIVPSSKALNNPYSNETRSSGELLKLRRENEDLKIELLKLKMKLREVQTPGVDTKSSISSPAASSATSTADQKPPLPRKSLMSSVKKFSRLFLLGEGVSPPSSKGRKKAPKDRRHSIS